jgi:hypothetical protein
MFRYLQNRKCVTYIMRIKPFHHKHGKRIGYYYLCSPCNIFELNKRLGLGVINLEPPILSMHPPVPFIYEWRLYQKTIRESMEGFLSCSHRVQAATWILRMTDLPYQAAYRHHFVYHVPTIKRDSQNNTVCDKVRLDIIKLFHMILEHTFIF